MSSSRFLFFLYYYPPVTGTAAKRNYRISNALSSTASSSIILTASAASTAVNIPANTTIKELPVLDYRTWLRRRTKDGALPESSKKSALAQWVIRLINTFPVNIIAGEGGLIYFINLLAEGKRSIKQDGITHLYSSYRPFADHYAAWWLKRRYPELIWIADFRDLIIDPHYNHVLFSEKHDAFFKNMFSCADVLTTVSEGLAKQLKAYNKNVITLKNGIAGEITQPSPNPSPSFTIAFTGSMFLDKRNAEPIFQALQELLQETKIEAEDIGMIYAGKDGSYWKKLAAQYRFDSLLDDRGIVSNEEAKKIQDQACINLLLTVSSDKLQGVLTGKMIEYFESGSPVLAIVVGQNDPELQSIIRELETGDSFSDQPEDLENIKSFILHEYLLWKQTSSNRKPVNMDILRTKYSMEAVMAPLLYKLSALSSQPSDTSRQVPDA